MRSMPRVLDLLGLQSAPESVDYIETKQQFHLHGLLTEQRHRKTRDLSFVVRQDVEAGLRQILEVDADIGVRLAGLVEESAALEQAATAVVEAVRAGHRIYVYGCGATGRLAKQMESSFWRPFWRRLRASPVWSQLAAELPDPIEDLLVGEMTGADRALVSSLEGFEDLMVLGELQLRDHGVQAGDVVICVTEGGETSSVIGTILAARALYADDQAALARRNLYFVYNNPDDVLRRFTRSALVLDEPGITRINLATGPQAISGSTRMQATTIETWVIGVVLEEAIGRLLRPHLDDASRRALGYRCDVGIAVRLRDFDAVRVAIDGALASVAAWTELESETYRAARFATYYAEQAMITVFIDAAERSPTFRLFPLDRVDEAARRCWVQVWTDGESGVQAWHRILGRPFRGLDATFYHEPLAERVADRYLRAAALSSLRDAGDDQETRYDFSFSAANVARCGPGAGDLGVLVLVDDELIALRDPRSSVARFAALCRERGARLVVMHVGDAGEVDPAVADLVVSLRMASGDDPIGLRRQTAMKILLNAHSTATMARLGRVVGNTMTNVSPSNLKLIGRATFLIQSHANDVLGEGVVSYAEANAVLFDAIGYVRGGEVAQTAEVALSIVRIVESWRTDAGLTWQDAQRLLEAEGLAEYLRARR